MDYLWRVGSDLAPSAIQSGAETPTPLGSGDDPEERQLVGVPGSCFATQQDALGSAVEYAGRDEHVAPLQPCRRLRVRRRRKHRLSGTRPASSSAWRLRRDQ